MADRMQRYVHISGHQPDKRAAQPTSRSALLESHIYLIHVFTMRLDTPAVAARAPARARARGGT